MTIKELVEKRDALLPRLYELRDKIADTEQKISDEDEANWKQINDDLNDFDRRIERLKAIESRENQAQENVSNPDVGRGDFDKGKEKASRTNDIQKNALRAWALGKCRTDEQRDAVAALGINVDSPAILTRLHETAPRSDREARALGTLEGSAGGFLVPPAFVNALETAMLAYGGMRQVAEIIRTTTGAPMPWPTSDDTSNEGVQIGENAAMSEDDPTVSQTTWNAYEFSSNIVKVPRTLFEDSGVNIDAMLGAMLGERLGRIQNRKCTTGTGAATPMGLTIASTAGKTTASSTAITFDEIVDLVHSVDPAYRTGAGFMMHDNIILALRKLKDGEGRYLWSDGSVQNGEPPRLWGYPVSINQHMASSIASTAITMEFGQLSKYKIREVRDITLSRLVERYAEYNQVGFVATMRFDGNLLDAGTHPVKHLVQV